VPRRCWRPAAARSATSVAETTRKRDRLVREILLGSVMPQALLAVLTLALVWFGVARGLAPLERLSGGDPQAFSTTAVRSSPADSRPLPAGHPRPALTPPARPSPRRRQGAAEGGDL